MKYFVYRVTPELKALSYSLLVAKFGFLSALFIGYISTEKFFFAYIFIFIISMIVELYRGKIVDEDSLTL